MTVWEQIVQPANDILKTLLLINIHVTFAPGNQNFSPNIESRVQSPGFVPSWDFLNLPKNPCIHILRK